MTCRGLIYGMVHTTMYKKTSSVGNTRSLSLLCAACVLDLHSIGGLKLGNHHTKFCRRLVDLIMVHIQFIADLKANLIEHFRSPTSATVAISVGTTTNASL
jgi:hypothetical protein